MATRDETVAIMVDGQQIKGTLIAPNTLIPGVLFVHGWGGSHEQYITRAREMASLGCICMVFDLRGHADTHSQKETVSREDNLRDVLAAYDVLARRLGVDRSAIAVVGSSYGGYLAALLTTLRPVKWLALRVPALYKDSEWEVPKDQLRKSQDLDAYRRQPVRPEESRALRACAAFEGDVLIVQSERDDVVPPQVIQNYREACTRARSLTFRTLEGADHGLSQERWQHAYTSILVNWLSEMVLGARAGADAVQHTTALTATAQPAARPG
jgi:pimeloyl-ACP methyl ester carboxylesterase